VLFRGGAEAAIRRSLVDAGFVKGIIGLPANLFYGTGIPACIIIIDKENHEERKGIFIIDARRDFIKDENKNRLRERDVYKITTVFNEQIELPKYSRFVHNKEIIKKNDYNLNIPRYIDSSAEEDLQNIDGHLKGGIPSVDVDSLTLYWQTFPKLKESLFKPLRKGFYSLVVEKDTVRDTIYSDEDFSAYVTKTTVKKKKDGTEIKKTVETGWNGLLIPKELIIEKFFSKKQKVINDADTVIAAAQVELNEIIENAEEDSIINEVLKENGNIDKSALNIKLKDETLETNDKKIIKKISDLVIKVDEGTKLLKDLKFALDKEVREHYSKLSDEQSLDLLLERKWYRSIRNGILALYSSVSHLITERIAELADRYDQTLPELEDEVKKLEKNVKSHLERMGFVW